MRQALVFLTAIPITAQPGPPGSSAWAFPLVGVLLGLMAAVVYPLRVGPVLALIIVTLATGALHEDGLADAFDSIRATRTRDKMLDIMKDSRIGAHGAAALVLSFLFRWQALAALQGDAWMRLPAAFGISRAVIVLLASTTPAQGEGLGRAFTESLTRRSAALALAQIVVLTALVRWPAAAWLVTVNLILVAILRRWFIARLGGTTGDCLGAACQISEAASLGVLTCV
jgi:adenosylcobinamide-GDP ribazoletransferase